MSSMAPDMMSFSGAYDPQADSLDTTSIEAAMARRNHSAAMDPVYGTILRRVESLAGRTADLYPIGDDEPYLDAYEQTLFLNDLKEKPESSSGTELIGKPVDEPINRPVDNAQAFEDERDLQMLFRKLF